MANKIHNVRAGDKFSRWTVIEANVEKDGERAHLCKCVCGEIKAVNNGNLVHGKSKSCGCLAREKTSANSRTHGKSGSRIYGVWNRMHTRCRNPKIDRWHRYGGRGIRVCERWSKFENFYEDMGDVPEGKYSIGRIDNDGNYCPENCRWETDEQQRRNICTNVFIEHNGETKTIAEWAKYHGIGYATLRGRYIKGVSPSKLFKAEKLGLHYVTINNIKLLLTEWFKVLGIPISSFYLKKRSGKTEIEIIESYFYKKFTV